MKHAQIIGILLAIIASGYGFHISYAYLSKPPSLEEMQSDRNSKNKEVRDRCHIDASSHATGNTERERIIASRKWEDSCLQEYLLDDIKTNTGTSNGATIGSVPWGTGTINVKTGVNENQITSNGGEKRESDDSRTKQSPLTSQTIQMLRESKNLSLLEVLGLDACRIVQDEVSHVTQKRGHVYATDIACERGQSFTVSAPQWKKSYSVKSVGYEKRIGNYIVLESGDYMFVFGHTESPHKIGDIIQAGTQIGYTDKSGIAENIHLHFELWRSGYNITHEEMLGEGSKWNDEYSFKLLTQRGWYTGIDDAINYITSFEGFRDTSYEDPKGSGRWSIGFGTHASGPGETITRDIAKKRLYTKVFQNMEFIYKNRLALSWNERIALSSFFYNLGIGRPDIVQSLKKRDMNDIESTWKSYISPGTIYEKGLLKRRVKEWEKFTSK